MVCGIGDQRHWRRINEDWERGVVVWVDLISFTAANVHDLLHVDWSFVVPFLTVGPQVRPS